MEKVEAIDVPVPEGFPALCQPVHATNRIHDGDIILEPANEEDLPAIADALYTCFPESWWSETEPVHRRPAYAVRVDRMAKRMQAHLTHNPHIVFLVARIASTGEFAGFAGWAKPRADKYNPNLWLCDVPGGDREGFLGWKSGFQRSEAELSEVWQAVEVEKWLEMWSMYERVRSEEMGSEPHWYLAPLLVLEKFRGRAIGSALMNWAIEQADAESPPTPLYLEAFRNARPVYLHLGFQAVQGEGREAILIRRGPAQSAKAG